MMLTNVIYLQDLSFEQTFLHSLQHLGDAMLKLGWNGDVLRCANQDRMHG